MYAHNIETVDRLQKRVRDYRAGYRQSLAVLEGVKKKSNGNMLTKSSIMLGCGEYRSEVYQTMKDLRDAGVDVVTLGQYLRPSKRHMAVREFITPLVFDEWKEVGHELGFQYVASGPMVRSSFKAGEMFVKNLLNKKSMN